MCSIFFSRGKGDQRPSGLIVHGIFKEEENDNERRKEGKSNLRLFAMDEKAR